MAGGTDFQMFEILLILAVVTIGGAAVCSGALAGGLALGFLPGNAQDVFHRGGHRRAALLPDGVLPLLYVHVPAPALVERAHRPRRRGPASGRRGAGRGTRPSPGGLNRGGGPTRTGARIRVMAPIVVPPGSRYH